MEFPRTVTQIEQYQKNKFKVYLNDEFAFVLYKGELAKQKIEEGTVISEEMYSGIIREILNKRATKRAMYLLKAMERTEHQLREKLRENLYPEESIDAAVAYVSSYHYVNDEDYARRYTQAKSGSKSRRRIEQELKEKGISKDKIERAVQEADCNDRNLIREIIIKKSKSVDVQDQKQKQKIIRHLLYKGFAWEDIRTEMEHLT